MPILFANLAQLIRKAACYRDERPPSSKNMAIYTFRLVTKTSFV